MSEIMIDKKDFFLSSEDVLVIDYEGKKIVLVGTNHISAESVELVERVITEVKPDTVCVELDAVRAEKYLDPEAWGNMDIVKIIKEGKLAVLFFNILYSTFQNKLAQEVGTKSGGEMLQAMISAEKIGAKVELIDRDSQITFKRMWRGIPFFKKPYLFWNFLTELDVKEQEELEQLLDSENLDSIFYNIKEKFPSVFRDMISDRDKYMATKLTTSEGKTIVAVVGKAHLIGIKNNIGKKANLKELDEIPKKPVSSRVIEWSIPLIIICLLGLSFRAGVSAGTNQLFRWFLWNGGLSALFTVFGLAHPLTVLVTLVTAPIGALSPILSVGFFSAITEATLRKPVVNDFLNVQKDINKVRSFFKNRVLRIMLVFFLASVGGGIGNIVGGLDIIKNILR